MGKNRLGCLSPLALITALLTIILLIGAEVRLGNAIFSPGALNAVSGSALNGVSSHAETEEDCAACHAAPWSGENMTVRCFACHTEIQQDNADSSTLHGAFYAQNLFYNCRDCHTEHHGSTADLTTFDPADFPHTVTGFDLAGHALLDADTPFACADCHTAGLTGFNAQVCLECHHTLEAAFTTTHVLDFWTDCRACHDGVDRYGDFDHTQTDFALSGLHTQVACSGCHLGARSMADLQNTPSECEACHLQEDAHAGEYGVKCEVCHSPEGWKPAAFNHDLADFKLVGEHAAVDCAACHTQGFSGTPQECAACHAEQDIHAGRLGADCATCHTPAGWKPSEFDHNLAAFKLEGQHAAVACADCHTAGYAGTPQDCKSCHLPDDAHNGRFGLDCETCHEPAGWKPADFNHNRAAFKLQGAHSTVKCEACHINGYAGTPATCVACHRQDDAHAGQFGLDCATCHSSQAWKPAQFDHSRTNFKLQGQHVAASCTQCHVNGQFKGTPTECVACHRTDDAHQGQFGLECAKCHTAQAWKPAQFDHSQTSFPLRGQHVSASCTQCHSNGQFDGTPQDCAACHRADDAHNGQFGQDCGSCHNPSDWKDASFDHSRTAFALQGRHTQVACTQCHANGQFDGTPTECVACHRTDDAHQGAFGVACGSCHNPSSWGDASFDHSLTSFPLRGQHAQAACTQCHANGQFDGTPTQCVACHRTDDAHQGAFGVACGSCHNPSSWGDASFDHSQTSFPLRGQHAQAACQDCHSNGQFDGTPQACAACHQGDDAHNGSFGNECGACHNPSSWGDASFDHSLSGFPLTGAHANVSCENCHANGQYSGTPSQCAACHSEPAFHAGMFGGQACSACHSTSAWRPADYNGAHSFPMNHGDANTCSDCHRPDLTQWSCYNCHDRGEMADKHKEIGDFSNCLSCHADGRKHDD
jgi:hypothetical protein